ncbi:hypothetical protein AAC387_Pa02g0631 [Persea americana]
MLLWRNSSSSGSCFEWLVIKQRNLWSRAVRLEQMSKAVRWLVLELQHGSGTANSSHPHSGAPFDSRFSEDAPQ